MQIKDSSTMWGVPVELVASEMADGSWKLNAFGPKGQLVRGLAVYEPREAVFAWEGEPLEEISIMTRKSSTTPWNIYLLIAAPVSWIIRFFFKAISSMVPNSSLGFHLAFPAAGMALGLISLVLLVVMLVSAFYLLPVFLLHSIAMWVYRRQKRSEEDGLIAAIRALFDRAASEVQARSPQLEPVSLQA